MIIVVYGREGLASKCVTKSFPVSSHPFKSFAAFIHVPSSPYFPSSNAFARSGCRDETWVPLCCCVRPSFFAVCGNSHGESPHQPSLRLDPAAKTVRSHFSSVFSCSLFGRSRLSPLLHHRFGSCCCRCRFQVRRCCLGRDRCSASFVVCPVFFYTVLFALALVFSCRLDDESEHPALRRSNHFLVFMRQSPCAGTVQHRRRDDSVTWA